MSAITDKGPFLCVEEVVRLFKISRTKAYKALSCTSRLAARSASRPFASADQSGSCPSRSNAWPLAESRHDRPPLKGRHSVTERRTRTH